jgi:predicted porin
MRFRSPLVIAGAVAIALAGAARADDASDLKAKFEELQKQMESLKSQLDQVNSQLQKQKEEQAKAKEEQAKAAPAGGAVPFLKKKEGDPLTFITPGGEVTLYGQFDVSLDNTTKGISGKTDSNTPPQTPVGRVGWMPGLSTNFTYIGARGFQKLVPDWNFVYQLETQVDLTASSGTVNTNSNSSSVVKGGLTTRNSFIGVANKEYGAFKVGKTDAPYKTSTARMDPFNGMIGTYSIVMGNTGGDNRVEFGTRLDKSVWYESPKWQGASFNFLWSPAQNRSTDNSNIAAGETDCSGGNVPGSGALAPSCNDGSWGTVYSANIAYEQGPIYGTVAYEMHTDVNRSSDQPTAAFPQGDPRDIGDEWAVKVGVQYKFPTKTTVSAIWEKTRRNVPAFLEVQNERTRDNATWLAVTQQLTDADNVSVGWAHAGGTPGDPGQHNTGANVIVDPVTGTFGNPHPDNQANMFTAALKHNLNKATLVYFDWALTLNHPFAHYDLGAGGRGLTTDCHDASQLAAFDPTANGGAGGVSGNGPRCWAGGRLQGVSIGVNYKF